MMPWRSLTGCSAAMLLDLAPDVAADDRRRHGQKVRVRKTQPVDPRDAVPDGTCPRCGYPGPHKTPLECISALRARLARWE
jgi:hypothetical protein